MKHLTTALGARLAYDDVGDGPPVLALHGAYSAHDEVRAFLDPLLTGRRRLYPDLPGHSESTADGVTSAADSVTALCDLLEDAVGGEPVSVVGHSFGAHLARGLAARRPEQVRGLALICPMVPDDMEPEPPAVVVDDGVAHDLPQDESDAFAGYFVVRTTATLARFREAVAPLLGRWDSAAVEQTMRDSDLDLPGGYRRPVLVLTGRHDAWVGFRQHVGLLEAYPRATSVVLADAGHALPHEQPEAFALMIRHWLETVDAQAP